MNQKDRQSRRQRRLERPNERHSSQLSVPRTDGAQKPLWVPEDIDLDFVPAEVQQAVAELVEPVYKQFVMGSAAGLENSIAPIAPITPVLPAPSSPESTTTGGESSQVGYPDGIPAAG
jgi:hypothetical protein